MKALIFDVDGTLADTEKDGHRVAFNRAFVEAGLGWHWSESLYGKLLAVTGGKERIRYYLETFHSSSVHYSDLDGFISDLHKNKTKHYTAMLERGAIPLRTGVRRLLEEARIDGLRLAIATTTTPVNVRALLRHTLGASAETWFDVIAAGDIVPAKKPAPDIYLWAMAQMGLSPPQCLAFEDSENGVRSASGAGLKSVVVTVNDYTRGQDFSGSSLVLDQLGEPGNPCQVLEGILKGIQQLDVAGLRRLHAQVYPLSP